MGLCDYSTGECVCQAGFEGHACERTSCPNDCNYNEDVYDYSTAWDAERLFGCDCDDGWEGVDCSLRVCPKGDDPLTTGQANEQQQLQCQCDGGCSGGVYLSFRGETTTLLQNDASTSDIETALEALTTIGSVTVTGTTLCDAAVATTTIEFLTESGDVPPLEVDYSELSATTLSFVVLYDGAGASVAGTKEFSSCNDRGICNTTTGGCVCFTDYSSSDKMGAAGYSGDCGVAGAVAACPDSCNGNGYCDTSTYSCVCHDGFTGGDCSQSGLSPPLLLTLAGLCPKGVSWFGNILSDNLAHASLTECSDRGICNRTGGDCICVEGWEGGSCDRLACPSDLTPAETDTQLPLVTECGGHGRCLSMSDLARNAAENGVPKSPEIQSVTCIGEGGSFTFAYNGFTTASIGFGEASADTIRDALQALPSIGRVEVSFISGAAACAASPGNTFAITFLDNRGDIDDIGFDDSSLTGTDPGIAIAETRKGTTLAYGDFGGHAEGVYWDANLIRGCWCDVNKTHAYRGEAASRDRFGYDCSKVYCPTGHDPSVIGVDEIQSVTCDATGGTFTLSFRGQTTSAISASAPASDVEEVLEELYTLDSVTVTYGDGKTTACEAGGVVISVEFLTEHGTLPLLEADTQLLTGGAGTAVVAVETAGTKLNAVCSNRGICGSTPGLVVTHSLTDYDTGVCACQTGYGSSDGAGGSGGRLDCGYLFPS